MQFKSVLEFMLRYPWALFKVRGAFWACVRILCWPPSRARFDRIVNGG